MLHIHTHRFIPTEYLSQAFLLVFSIVVMHTFGGSVGLGDYRVVLVMEIDSSGNAGKQAHFYIPLHNASVGTTHARVAIANATHRSYYDITPRQRRRRIHSANYAM